MNEQLVVNKLLINYHRFQKNGEKTVIFLHGWRSEGSIWKEVATNMKYANLAIYALDLPGFGKSAIPKEAYSIQDYVDIVIGFIKKLNLRNIIIVGHSFGGRITIKLSATHPELIDKLVLVDSAGLILNTKKVTLKKIFAKIAKPFFGPKFMHGLRTKIYQRMGAEDYIATPYLKEIYLKTIRENLQKFLPNIIVPTLIIWGRNDEETPLQFAEIMHKEIKNSKMKIFDNAGHFSFIDKPKEFCDELRNFIKEE